MLAKETIADYFKTLQKNICRSLEDADGGAGFTEDTWERQEGGGGCTCIIQNGHVIEKGGVAFSAVHGAVPAFLKSESITNSKSPSTFFATGLSIVIHPKSPMVPIIHMNVRYFEMDNGVKWFGGGIDLTPHYVDEEDARYFHRQIKAVCDKFDSAYYPDFKKQADDYFFIRHRNETRGVGGIFFDHLKPSQQ
ncbi:MAG: coproporphyrinogen III oxidase, partial [Bacteroidia bacterium]|nr:coproporphyrinogen III oxidase [Bacteroidia bacterium]